MFTGSKAPFSSSPLISPRREFSKVASWIRTDMSAIEVSVTGVFLGRPRPRLTGSRVFSTGCSAGCSFLVLLSSSDSGLVSACKYSFTVVDLKSIGPLGSCTLYISPLRASKVYSLVYLLL